MDQQSVRAQFGVWVVARDVRYYIVSAASCVWRAESISSQHLARVWPALLGVAGGCAVKARGASAPL
jgi:hypothetical protein